MTHPTAEVVYEAARAEMETISLKTVYQTLNELAELGEIAALDLGTGTMRFDPNVERAHHHLVCRSCGKVRDLDVDVRRPDGAGRRGPGLRGGRAEVVFRGLCGECRRRRSLRPRRRHRAATSPQSGDQRSNRQRAHKKER